MAIEAYLHGVSTPKVDDLVKKIGAREGISKSKVSRIYAGLDGQIAPFCHRILSHAVVVAVGVSTDGRREVLGFDVGDTENEGFSTGFLRSLHSRGLNGVALVMSDAPTGLREAVSTCSTTPAGSVAEFVSCAACS